MPCQRKDLFLLSSFSCSFFLIPLKSHAEVAYCSGQLSNGLTYYIHHDPHSKHHISLDFIIKTGPLHEQETERGFSHLIEHSIGHQMQFKGKKITDLRCAIWDYTYPNIETVTSYAFTQFHFELSLALPRGLEEGLLGFSHALSRFSLDEQYLRDMKEEVLEEFDKQLISPVESWKQWRIEQEYPPYRNKNPFGNLETISEASLEHVEQFFRKNYRQDRIAVVIVGKVDLQKTKLLIEKTFGAIPALNENEVSRPNEKSFPERISVYFNKRLKNNLISLSKPLPKMSQRNFLTFSILTRLLSQHLRTFSVTPQAKFSQPILEILTYPQMLRLTVSLPKIDEEGIDQLRETLDSFFNQPTTEAQLDLIKAEMKIQLKLLREKGNDPFLIDFYRDHFILNASSLETDHPDLRTDLLDTIHAEDINRMLHAFQGFSQASLCSFINADRIPTDLLSKLLLKNDDLWRNTYVD